MPALAAIALAAEPAVQEAPPVAEALPIAQLVDADADDDVDADVLGSSWDDVEGDAIADASGEGTLATWMTRVAPAAWLPTQHFIAASIVRTRDAFAVTWSEAGMVGVPGATPDVGVTTSTIGTGRTTSHGGDDPWSRTAALCDVAQFLTFVASVYCALYVLFNACGTASRRAAPRRVVVVDDAPLQIKA